MRVSKLLLPFFFFACITSASAQEGSTLSDKFSTTYFTYLYNFQFNDVNKLLDNIDAAHQVEKPLYYANYYFWKTITGDSSKNYFALSKKQLNDQLGLIKKSAQLENEQVFYNAYTYSYLMRLELNQDNYMAAVKILDKSIKEFEKALNNKEKYEPLILLSGLYNYFMVYAKEKVPAMNIYLNKYKPGNKATGLAELKKCAESSNIVIKTEALYFLTKIYLNTEKDLLTARQYAEQLVKLHPKNITYHREYFLVLSGLELPKEVQEEKDKIAALVEQNDQLTRYQKSFFRNIIP